MMNTYRLLAKLNLLSVFILTASCANTPVIDGWVDVNFSSSVSSINKGGEDYSSYYDEFVGSLIDDGLEVEKSVWLKPTYGNENYLWTNSSKVGDFRKQRIAQSEPEFSKNFYEFYEDSLTIENSVWSYSGYLDKSGGKNSPPFQIFVYVCEGRATGISVFYWGAESSVLSFEQDSTINLLNKLSAKCN